ncbi:hypothetical protein HXX76_016049 [Chlamydomonas incerta]|uniref:BTB domain-containing protein n=1 Tax=Chlamydomonas incerta TaxID=51695 RepID=A0A835SH77_CHLIN|nr:hypothetical protein HXX76_016049 [Chlamydomonas incerta]|eukprot:KAG2422404.1 hypothetical protein HXX76_016049 [Chlamydomonas incerta]
MAAHEGPPTLLSCCIVIDGPSGVATRVLPPAPQQHHHRAFPGHARPAFPPQWPSAGVATATSVAAPPVPPVPRTQTLVSFFGSRELRPLLGADGRSGLQLGPALQLYEAPAAPPPPPPAAAPPAAPPRQPGAPGREPPPPPHQPHHGHGHGHAGGHPAPPRRPFVSAAGFGHMTWCPFSSCLYIIAGQAILRLTHDDSVSLVAGHPSETFRRDGPGPSARFVALRFLTADGRGSLYTADGTRLRHIRLPAAWRAGNAWGGGPAAEDGAGAGGAGGGGAEGEEAGEAEEAGAEAGRPGGGDGQQDGGGGEASGSDGEGEGEDEGAGGAEEGEEGEGEEGPVPGAEALVSTLPFEAAADVWGLAFDATREYSQLLPGEGFDGFAEAGGSYEDDGDSDNADGGDDWGRGVGWGTPGYPAAGASGRGWAYGNDYYGYGGRGGGGAEQQQQQGPGQRRGRQRRRAPGGGGVGAEDPAHPGACGGSLIYNTDTAIYRVPLPRPRPPTRPRHRAGRHGAGAAAGADDAPAAAGANGAAAGRAPAGGARSGGARNGGGAGGGPAGGGVLAPWLLAGNEFEAGSADGRGDEARFLNIFGLVLDGRGCVYLADRDVERGVSVVRRATPDGAVVVVAGGLANDLGRPALLPNGCLALCSYDVEGVHVVGTALRPPPCHAAAAAAAARRRAAAARARAAAARGAAAAAAAEGGSDLTIVVGERRFPVHRLVLSTRCDYFRQRLAAGGGFADAAAAELELPDADADAFALLLRWLYTGGVVVPPAAAPGVAELADRLLLPELCAEAQGVALGGVGADSVVELMLWADSCGPAFAQLLAALKGWYIEHQEEVVAAAPDSLRRLRQAPDLAVELLVAAARRAAAVAAAAAAMSSPAGQQQHPHPHQQPRVFHL